MIRFETLKFKNFLSTGNNFTEINFIKNKTTLVVGLNGAGKSTMLDALSFALFGKPHRSIKKDQMVNSINNKNAVVEVEFSIGQHKFKVVRGIKPNVFEIWKNGEMVNQDSHSREYQKILEQNILKLNHKSFHQIVVLGSTSFVPFMQLSTHHRREIIEDLLDIHIFSRMNMLIKERLSTLKEKHKQIVHQEDIVKTKIEAQKKYIRDITLINTGETNKKKSEIKEAQSQIKALIKTNEKHLEVYNKNYKPLKEKQDAALENMQEYSAIKKSLLDEANSLVKQAKFYEDHDNCPTCEQAISLSIKSEVLNKVKTTAGSTKKKIDEADTKYNEFDIEYTALSEKLGELAYLEKEVHGNNKTIESLQLQIDKLQNEIDAPTNNNNDISTANSDLDKLKADREELFNSKSELNEQVSYSNVIIEMLKDTGIKTKIIKQYLPVMNKLINEYLQILDFYVSFNIDENFIETIKSRHRDEFTYDSFSEGEKQRIDLALMFTWRMIAKMKNSVSTNLLILDETFDSSLDHDGIENLMKILDSFDDNTNVFVISHKGDLLDGKFNNKLEFVKDKNFSKCLEAA